MLDINLIREKPDLVRQALSKRQLDPAAVDSVLALDGQRRDLIQQVETLKAERNAVSIEIGKCGSRASDRPKSRRCGKSASASIPWMRNCER